MHRWSSSLSLQTMQMLREEYARNRFHQVFSGSIFPKWAESAPHPDLLNEFRRVGESGLLRSHSGLFSISVSSSPSPSHSLAAAVAVSISFLFLCPCLSALPDLPHTLSLQLGLELTTDSGSLSAFSEHGQSRAAMVRVLPAL